MVVEYGFHLSSAVNYQGIENCVLSFVKESALGTCSCPSQHLDS